MSKHVEVLFAPAEYANLQARDLSQTTCVVFDILRATSTMLTALANGAKEIIPVSEIDEALALRRSDPQILLAGERHGLRIDGFDLGNSPREFLPNIVGGRRIAMTTTNGTRALRACAHAAEVYIGAFLNLSALAASLSASRYSSILLICAGTGENASLEDTLAAGALIGEMKIELSDSAQIALSTFQSHSANLPRGFSLAHNGRRLLSIPELRDDVAVCLRRDSLQLTALLHHDGAVRRS